MKKYKIPCAWEMYGVMEVEADSLDAAIETAAFTASYQPTQIMLIALLK